MNKIVEAFEKAGIKGEYFEFKMTSEMIQNSKAVDAFLEHKREIEKKSRNCNMMFD